MKFLSCSLTALKSGSWLRSISHRVSENKSIKMFSLMVATKLFPLLLNMFYVHGKYMLRIALLHGFLIRNDNSSYEQMIAVGQ